jgi:hypothetical protein
MSALPATPVPTFGKLIPRLASSHDEEVVASARVLGRVLKSGGGRKPTDRQPRWLRDIAARLRRAA